MMTVEGRVSSILVACGNRSGVERHYLPALVAGGWPGPCQVVEPGDPLPDLDGVGGVLVAGGLTQSAIIGRYSADPEIRAAARNSDRAVAKSPVA